MGVNKPPAGGGVSERKVQFGPSQEGMGVWSPRPVMSSMPGQDTIVADEAKQIARLLLDTQTTMSQAEIAQRVGARMWGPGRLSRALSYAVSHGLIRRMGRGRYAPPEMAPGEKKEAH